MVLFHTRTAYLETMREVFIWDKIDHKTLPDTLKILAVKEDFEEYGKHKNIEYRQLNGTSKPQRNRTVFTSRVG